MSGQLGDIHGKQLLARVPKASTTDADGNVTSDSIFVIKKIKNAATLTADDATSRALAAKINAILVVLKSAGLVHYRSQTSDEPSENI